MEQAIYDELTPKKTPIGFREMQKAKNQLEADFVFDQESILSLGQKVAEYEVALDWASIGAYVPSIRSVSAQEIQRVASKYFTAQNRNIGILIPTGPPGNLPGEAAPQPAGGGINSRSIRLRASDVRNEVIP